MAEIVQIEDALVRLGHVRAEEEDDDDRKRDVKALVFGDPTPPRRIGRFIDLGLLGHGAMGTVRRAYDERLAREVAIKLVRHGSAPRHHERLLREAQALAQLSHPNVVQIYEVGELDGEIFIAMELIEGATLHEWQRQPKSWRECLKAYLQAGRGLAAAHATGLVHRDFKPTNCIRDEAGRVRVLDFGLARAVGFVEPPHPPPRDSEEFAVTARPSRDGATASCGTGGSLLQVQLTEKNAVVGTLAYMAPEQLGRRRADAKSDQFSFCVALYEALYGLFPFSRDPRPALIAMMGGQEQTPLLDADSPKVPRRLRRVVLRGLSGDPEARWPSMDALLHELERVEKRRSVIWAAAGVMSVVLAGGGLSWSPSEMPAASPCLDAGDDAAELWGEEQRVRVEQALLATAQGYGEQTWTTVDEGLDRTVRELEAEYVEACEATKVRSDEALPDLELRNGCLDRQRDELNDTISMLAQADETVAHKAVELVAALPSLDACADLEGLRRAAEHEDSDDERAALVRKRLGQARRYRIVGKLQDGLRVVDELSALEPELTGSLLAEVLVEAGTLSSELGRPDHAEEQLRRARDIGVRQRDETVTLGALIPLIYVVGVDQANVEGARELGDEAESMAHRKGVGARLLAQVLTAQGHVLNAAEQHEQAQWKFEDALRRIEEIVGPDSIALAEPLDGLTVALRAHQDLESARRASQRSLDLRTDALGERHPDVAHQHANLAAVLCSMEDYEGALGHLQSALALLRDVEPTPRELRAHVRANLGPVLAKLEEYGAAEAMFEGAIEDWIAVHGPKHPLVAKARLGLGNLLRRRERGSDALEQLELALEIASESELEGLEGLTRNALEKVRTTMSSDSSSSN